MSIINSILVYDIECYPNMFMVGIKNLKNNREKQYCIYPDKQIDDTTKIIKDFTKKGDYYFTGFNNYNYDDALINFIINPKEEGENEEVTVTTLYNMSKRLVEDKDYRNPYRYKSAFKSIDMLEVLRKGFNVKSLKSIAVNLEHDKIQDLPIDSHVDVTPEQFELLKTYNINDLNITEKIVKREISKLELRQTIEQLYDNEISIIGDSDSGIAKKVLTKYYKDALEAKTQDKVYLPKKGTDRGDLLLVKDLVYERIKFQHPILVSFFNQVLEGQIVRTEKGEFSDKYEWKEEITFGNKEYTLGLGGIHTKDNPAVYRSDDKMMVLDVDVTSMYPTSFIKNELCPEHLDKEVFLSVLSKLVDERVEYKKLYKQTKQDKYNALQAALKIAVNTFYGLTNSKTGWLFDPKASFTCTVNNQLLMLMLIEQFVKYGHNVISANTDGVTLFIERAKLNDVRRIYEQWEEMSFFNLEESIYNIYLRRDVNNYIAVYDNGEIKYKGTFEPQEVKDLLKAFKYPVTTTALVNYFLYGTPVEETIRNCDNIYHFCFSQKCSDQFTNYLHKVERKYKVRHGVNEISYKYPVPKDTFLESTKQQRSLRFFVSNPQVSDTDQLDLADGYGKETHTGYSIRKHKMIDTVRYEAQTIGGQYFVVDLKDNKTIGDNFRLKKEATEVAKNLNTLEKASIQVESMTDYVAGQFVTMFNDYYAVDDFADYNINYDFYIDVAKKEIAKIEG